MAPVLCDEKPELGDLIEICRSSYQHWSVYVGDGFVVHLTVTFEGRGEGQGQSSSLGSLQTDRAVVKKEKLLDVVGDNKWKINNSLDNKYEPRPSHIIVKAACELVDQQWPYDLLIKNCEHFVNDLRYGKAESRQVLEAGEVVLEVATGVAAVTATAVVAGGLVVAAPPVALGVSIVALARAALFVWRKNTK